MDESRAYEFVLGKDEIVDIGTRKKVKPKAVVIMPMSRVLQLKSAGPLTFQALCVMGMVEKTMQRKIKKEQRPWFFVSLKFWRQYGIPKDSWYKSLGRLERQGIIKKKQGVGPRGRNLYAFTDSLEKMEK